MSRYGAICAMVSAALFVQISDAATVQDLVNQVSQTQYRHFLDDVLYTHDGHNRGMTGPQHDPCRDNIFNYFQSLGLQTSLDPHSAAYYGPACTNVVAVKPGTVRPQDIYIISAHYDSVDNPGADDNASAVAAVMEIARVLAPYQFEATIRFIAWDAEEVYPRAGSKGYALDHWTENLLGVISVEMISYNDGANKVYLGADWHRPIQDKLASAIQLYGQGLTTVFTNQIVDTDNWSFVYWGFENTYITEEWPNPNYHKLTDSVDTPNYIDYAYATKITRSLVGYLATETNLVGAAAPDTTPPLAVTTLGAAAGSDTGSISLTWTAPADYDANGAGPNPAASYNLRYSTSAISSNATFAAATKVAGLAAPKAPGLDEAFSVTGLTGGTTYYFAIKSADAAKNVSVLSNIASATTQNIVQEVLQTGLNGYAGQKDSYLVGNSTSNFGSATQMIVAGNANLSVSKFRRGILQFDVSSIPADAAVLSATLSLYSYAPAQVKGKTGAYGVYPVSQDWTDTQVNWTFASTNIRWTAPGGDFAATPDATAPRRGVAGVWYSWDVTARVQSWLAGTSMNYGWIVKCTNEGRNNQDYFYQSSAASVANRPKLAITYVVPGN